MHIGWSPFLTYDQTCLNLLFKTSLFCHMRRNTHNQRENWKDKKVTLVHDHHLRVKVYGHSPTMQLREVLVERLELKHPKHVDKSPQVLIPASNILPSYKERVFHMWQLHKRECPIKKPRQPANHSQPTAAGTLRQQGTGLELDELRSPGWIWLARP